MKRIILISFLCIIAAAGSYSQSNDSILIKKRKVYQNEKQLTGKELYTILKGDQRSASLAEKAHTNITIGTALAIPGSVLCLIGSGISLASSIRDANNVSNGDISTLGSDKSGGLIMGGAVLALAGLPFVLTGSSQNKRAIALYNSGKPAALNHKFKIEIRAGLAQASLICRF